MAIGIISAVVFSVLAFFATIWAGKYNDENYSKNTKGNWFRLSIIYAVVLAVSGIALWIFLT